MRKIIVVNGFDLLSPCPVGILLAPIANYSSREHYVSVGLLCLDDLLLHEGLVGRLIVGQD